jgi:hypothetical protein
MTPPRICRNPCSQESLLVNPSDNDEMAHAMRRAIEMPLEERVERHRAVMKRVRRRNATSGMPGVPLAPCARAGRLIGRFVSSPVSRFRSCRLAPAAS